MGPYVRVDYNLTYVHSRVDSSLQHIYHGIPMPESTLSSSQGLLIWPLAYCTLGSSDFPRSLCFMWFWFGLEILRLVYKKAFCEISYLSFYPSKKTAPSLIKVEKNFFEIGRAGYQKKRNFALISKMIRSLASRSSQNFVLRIFQVPKN